MRVAILSDTQYGSRNDYVPYLENNKKFFSEVFFPTCYDRKVEAIVHLGDLVERRKYISYSTAKYLMDDFLIPIQQDMMVYHPWEFHWILGNHDIYYRETMDVNAGLIFDVGEHYLNATEVMLGNTKVLFCPWIVDANREDTLQKIKDTDAKICFGHFELANFEVNRGQVVYDGMDSSVLDKFAMVLSGHYHHKSAKGNIMYVGSHAEFTWSDYGDEHGFHILDLEKQELEFISNPYGVMFKKIYYSDADGGPNYRQAHPDTIKDKIVKVFVKTKTDQDKYDTFMTQVEQAQPLDIQVIEDFQNINLEDADPAALGAKSTLDILRDYVRQSNTTVNVEKLDNLVVDLFNRASVVTDE
jgi:DNA repair exonuclease SbcCD nuclease subunit